MKELFNQLRLIEGQWDFCFQVFHFLFFFPQKFYWKRQLTYEIKLALIAQKAVVLWFQGQTPSDFLALN